MLQRSIFVAMRSFHTFRPFERVLKRKVSFWTNNLNLNRKSQWELLNNYHYYILSQRNFGKKIRVYKQPDVGEGTVEVDILEWNIKVGDEVKGLQVIGRGKYEKADVDILAPYKAKVHKIIVQAGNTVRVHEPLVEFEVETDENEDDDDDDDKISDIDDYDKKNESKSSQKLSKDNITSTVLAMPSVRILAKEKGINLENIGGTGKNGTITKEDLYNYINNQSSQKKISSNINPSLLQIPSLSINKISNDKIEKIIGIKRAMVKKMIEANNVPMFGYGDEIIMDKLVIFRKTLQPISEKYGIKITYLSFIIKALSLSLSNPLFSCLNGHINNECTELIHRSSHNIGIAIDSPEGLIVPNIKNCEQKSILQIASDLIILQNKSINNTITNDDITNGTITISNIGSIGGTYCNPICFVPEVMIGALGSIKQLPRYNNNGELIKSSVMAISWSADHRIIDGATVARFSNELKQYLENPETMLLHLK